MLDMVRREALKNIREVFHKYISCWYIEKNTELQLDFEETYKANSKMPIPTYDEMKERIFGKISEARFHFVITSPSKANCAVRIYRKELEIDGNPGGLCGAVCFVKSPLGKWTTMTEEGKEVEMSYDKTYEVRYWTSLLTRYEKPVQANYYDVYLKVVSNI